MSVLSARAVRCGATRTRPQPGADARCASACSQHLLAPASTRCSTACEPTATSKRAAMPTRRRARFATSTRWTSATTSARCSTFCQRRQTARSTVAPEQRRRRCSPLVARQVCWWGRAATRFASKRGSATRCTLRSVLPNKQKECPPLTHHLQCHTVLTGHTGAVHGCAFAPGACGHCACSS